MEIRIIYAQNVLISLLLLKCTSCVSSLRRHRIVPQYMMVQNIQLILSWATPVACGRYSYYTSLLLHLNVYGEHKTFVSQLYRIDWGMITNLLPDTNILNPHLKWMKHGKRHGVEMCFKHCNFYTAKLCIRTCLEDHISTFEIQDWLCSFSEKLC